MAETPNTPPAPSPAALASGVARGPSGRSVFVGLALGALIVAAALGVILSGGGKSPGYGPSGWTVFHDPAGYFTIALPPGWSIDGGKSGSGTMGSTAGSYSETDYTWVARDPTNGTAGPVVNIYYYPLPSALARHFECQNFAATNTTFDGLPASSIGGGWILATQAAHYQLNYGYPPDNRFYTNPPTAIPAATATAGTSLALQVANTFRPTPATALSC